MFEEIGFEAAVEALIHGPLFQDKLEVSLEVDADLGILRRDIALALYRIVQECLSNVFQHSGSSIASVQLRRAAQYFVLEVRDKGCGIPPSTLLMLRQGHSVPGLGVLGMHERLQMLGGTLQFDSSPQGTAVRASVPVIQPHHE